MQRAKGLAAACLEAVEGCDALLIGTSAKVAATGRINEETGRPNFGFPNGQPEQIDWRGQKNQIDAAISCGLQHVVICSSMGGTDPDHMLNSFAREEGDPPARGNILQWKRKAEKYLIDSGLTYTIIHPGGLIDEAGGCRELVVGVDDVIVVVDCLDHQTVDLPIPQRVSRALGEVGPAILL